MANAKDIRITYHDDQMLTHGVPGYVHINDDKNTSVVAGSSDGIDCTAVIEFGGLLEGEWAHIWWRTEWKKTGAETQAKTNDLQSPAVPYRASTGGKSAQARFAGPLKKADTGWTACLRLMYLTNSSTAFIARRQFRGWRLEA